jgi:heme exporter protein B
MAILSFPIIIPILMMAIRISKNALDGLDISVSVDKLLMLLAINAIVAVTGYILFPYLWKS